ncbi:MAG TPA: patatin-like phospholipase family protein [Elusimicrobiales bacterium]|nr:patatin-like phospholipase family protein [Elusimicrobiales bacterium]
MRNSLSVNFMLVFQSKFWKRSIIFVFIFLVFNPVFAYNPDDVARDFLWNKVINLAKENRPKAALALSAGGTRGFAHVGVLRVLTDAGMPIDCVAGASAGAFVGAFYSAGYPLQKLWDIVSDVDVKMNLRGFVNLTMIQIAFMDKLASSGKIEKMVNKAIGDISFKDLKIPFSCSAMDIKTGEKIIFNSGKVSKAVRASMNLPGIFKPVEYRHRYLVDGGVIDYLPVDSAKKLCKGGWILASVTKGDFSLQSLKNVLSYYLQVIEIRGSLLIANEAKKANFVIEPNVGEIGSTDLANSLAAGKIGLRQAYRDLNLVKESYILFSLKNVLEKYFKN